MLLQSIIVKGLHGLIDAEARFHEDLTILIGKNGSGKTSILNLLSNLLRFDLGAIRNTSFESVNLKLKDEKLGEVVIQGVNSENEKYLDMQISGGVPVRIPLDERLSVANLSTYLMGRINTFSSLEVSKEGVIRTTGNYPLSSDVNGDFASYAQGLKWNEASLAVQERTRLSYVRLDRTVLTMEPHEKSKERLRSERNAERKPTAQHDPIEDVIKVTKEKYLEFRAKSESIQKNAAEELLRLHFSPIKNVLNKREASEQKLQLRLNELRQRVAKSKLIAEVTGLQEVIDTFFKEFDELLASAFKPVKTARIGRKTLHEESVSIMINLKQHQLNELFKVFENEQSETANAFGPIRKYLNAVDRFLSESGKKLDFSQKTFDLGFTIPQLWPRADSRDGVNLRSVRELSSGEKQILVVLTHLAFLAVDESIFIIDEPELSLHITWQRHFIDAIRELRGAHCQIVLATHAPEIAGRARDKAQILMPRYMDRNREDQKNG